jgi:hypothetical protein
LISWAFGYSGWRYDLSMHVEVCDG